MRCRSFPFGHRWSGWRCCVFRDGFCGLFAAALRSCWRSGSGLVLVCLGEAGSGRVMCIGGDWFSGTRVEPASRQVGLGLWSAGWLGGVVIGVGVVLGRLGVVGI